MKEFQEVCPTCNNKDKVIVPCLKCFKQACSSCSIDKLCIECYVLGNSLNLVSEYFEKTRVMIK